jgi:hypothetical protein
MDQSEMYMKWWADRMYVMALVIVQEHLEMLERIPAGQRFQSEHQPGVGFDDDGQQNNPVRFDDHERIENLESLGEEHQILKPNLITGMTAYGEFTKPGSQVEGMKTPQYWEDPLIHVPGSSKLEWFATGSSTRSTSISRPGPSSSSVAPCYR